MRSRGDFGFVDGQLRPEYACAEDFIEVCGASPKGEHDDVDALTQLLVYFQKKHRSLSASEILAAVREDDEKDDGGVHPYRGVKHPRQL